MKWVYVTELTYESEIEAIRKADTRTQDGDSKKYPGTEMYFERAITIWSRDGSKHQNDTPYYDENIYADNKAGHRALLTAVFRS